MEIYEVRLQTSKRIYTNYGYFTNQEVATHVADGLSPKFEDTPAEVVKHTVDTTTTVTDFRRTQLLNNMSPEDRELLGL